MMAARSGPRPVDDLASGRAILFYSLEPAVPWPAPAPTRQQLDLLRYRVFDP